MTIRDVVRSPIQDSFKNERLAGGGGGVVGPALPQIGALIARWSADGIPNQVLTPVSTDNASVANWVDSISGYTASQGTGANQPKFRTAALGGKPGVQFSGTTYLNGLMAGLKTAIDTRTHSILILASQVAVRSNASMFGNSAGGNSYCFQANGTRIGRLNAASTLDLRLPFTDTVSAVTMGYTSSNTKVYPNQTGTALEQQYVNGALIASNAASCPVTSSASGAFGIGCINDLNNFPFQGYLFEILIWSVRLTPAEMYAAEVWARNKYSLTMPCAGLSFVMHNDGDSHIVGVTPSATDVATSPPYVIAQALGLTPGQWWNHAIGGMNTYGMSGADGGNKFNEMKALILATGKPPRILAGEFYNETITGRTAQAWNDTVAYATAVKTIAGAKLGMYDSFSYGTDAANYATDRGPFNTSFAGGWAAAGIDQVSIFSADPNIGRSDAFTNNPTNWAGDNVHLTNTARQTYFIPPLQTLATAIYV